jgi:hypothetical protein
MPLTSIMVEEQQNGWEFIYILGTTVCDSRSRGGMRAKSKTTKQREREEETGENRRKTRSNLRKMKMSGSARLVFHHRLSQLATEALALLGFILSLCERICISALQLDSEHIHTYIPHFPCFRAYLFCM